MWEKWKSNKIGILLLLTGAVYFFLQYVSPLMTPILLAMLFVTMFGPLLKTMQKRLHVHRQVGAVLLLFLAGAVVIALGWILGTWMIGSLPGWVCGLGVWEERILDILHPLCGTVADVTGVDRVYLEESLSGKIEEGISYLQYHAVPGMLSQSFTYAKVVAAVGGFLVTFLIATVLLAKDYDTIMNAMLERESCHVILEVICGIIRYIATFVKAQLIILSIIAGLAALVLGSIRVPHGVLWGILAGFLDALPFIGTGIVLVPLSAVQLLQGHYVKAAVCVILYVICIFVREMLEPRLIGKRIGVTPIMILLAIYGGIKLFGVWGIVKGPLGFVLIFEAYRSLTKECVGG